MSDRKKSKEYGQPKKKVRNFLSSFLRNRRQEPKPNFESNPFGEPSWTEYDRQLRGRASELRRALSGIERREASQESRVEAEEARFIDSVVSQLDIPEVLESAKDRVKLADLMTLHYLLVKGKLDDLYVDYLKTHPEAAPSEAEEKSIKVELALEFLDRVRTKNQETEQSRAVEYPITQGIEIEYDESLVSRFQDYLYYRDLLVEAGIPLDYSGFKGHRLKDVLADYSVPEDMRDELDYYKQLLDTFFEGNIPSRTEENVQENFVAKHPNVVEELGRLEPSPLPYTQDMGGYEVETQPSASYRTQMREVLFAHLAGGIGGESGWNLHQTLEGVKLTRDHTEVMDILLISAAAGYAGVAYQGQEGGETSNEKGEYPLITEVIPKWRFSGDEERIYFPFHKSRHSYETTGYLHGEGERPSVEERSILRYESTQFPLIIRHMRFSNRAAYAIRALQTRENHGQPDVPTELADLWTELISRWNELLQEEKIKAPEEYWSNAGSLRHPEYINTLSQIIYLSEKNPDFRKKARTLIRQFNAAVSEYV